MCWIVVQKIMTNGTAINFKLDSGAQLNRSLYKDFVMLKVIKKLTQEIIKSLRVCNIETLHNNQNIL